MSKALVTTASYLLLVDLETHHVVPIEGSRGEYYGISWFPGTTELVLSHSGVSATDLVDLASYVQSESGWVSVGRQNSPTFLSAPHQILCMPDHCIVCTNTGRNAITVIDPLNKLQFKEQRISAARWDRFSPDGLIGDHLNSVFLQGSKMFVLCHGHNAGSKLAVLSYPDLEVENLEYLDNLTGLHNIWLTSEGQRISCNSNSGALVDLDTRRNIWSAGSEIFCRGLGATDSFVVVGESQKTGRSLRISSFGGLWVVDRATWKTLDYISLGPYGAVNDVRLIDVPDEAHHGSIFEGAEALLNKDLRSEIRTARMELWAKAFDYARIWESFKFVFGCPQTLDDGSKEASEEGLCLALKASSHELTESKDTTFSFEYRMKEKNSHVSIVVDYNGDGGDRSMLALLIQKRLSDASLSLWRHEGSCWKNEKTLIESGLPTCGQVRVASTMANLCLEFSNGTAVELERKSLGLEALNRGLGLRWAAAAILPIECL